MVEGSRNKPIGIKETTSAADVANAMPRGTIRKSNANSRLAIATFSSRIAKTDRSTSSDTSSDITP